MRLKIIVFILVLMLGISALNAGVPGALPGQFSVSSTKKVYFSQGNLQYQASTNTWRFSPYQYTRIGSSGNSKVSASYSGWIDWFGWGTGNNPTQTSSSNSSYSTFNDWGINKISNGGDQANLWRTLTQAEWEYLFSGRANATQKRSMATVNNVKGYILLPDSWTLPSGLSFTANVRNKWDTNKYSLENWQKMEQNGAVFLPKTAATSKDTNGAISYSDTGWFSDDHGDYWASTQQSSNNAYEFSFYIIEYYSSYGVSVTDREKRYRLGVRLVLDSDKNVTYTITWKNYDNTTLATTNVAKGATPTYTGSTPTRPADAQYTYTFSGWTPAITAATANKTYTATYTQTLRKYVLTANSANTTMGTVTDGGTFDYGTNHRLTATPKECYQFIQWSDGNTDNPRVVTVTSDTTFTAIFAGEKYIVTFNANGGLIPTDGNMGNTPSGHTTTLSPDRKTGTVVVTYGKSHFNLMLNDCPTREGYTFDGWYTDPVDGEQVYDCIGVRVSGSYWNNESTDVQWIYTSNVTLYAHWKVNPHPELQQGALPGVFSVSNSQKVLFSQGNLQYYASYEKHDCADGTRQQGTWRFANHQYDTIGSSQVHKSQTYKGWISAFAWGTSGWNSGAVIYQPWTVTHDDYDNYYPGGDMNNDLTGDYSYADWGVYNAILNGGKTPNMWRVLSFDEWDYLLNTRANATNLRSYSKINGIKGLILLPDDFVMPVGIEFVPSDQEASVNYSLEQWMLLENNGAVFLPNDYVYAFSAGNSGWNENDLYYTSSHMSNSAAACLRTIQSTKHGRWRCDAALVRVVCAAPIRYNIFVQPNHSGAGTTQGSGMYFEHAQAQISATPNTCYQFIRWSDGNTDNPRTITVTEDATYTAEFELIKYNITFVDAEGTQIGGVQSVNCGDNAIIPTLPAREGYTFAGWIGNYQNVNADATIYASYYKNSEASVAQPGALDGVFSVSPTEKVLFSQGNLHYHAMAGTHACADDSMQKGVWRFAEHQYDTIGKSQKQKEEDYAGWISTFGWGTSGWNSGANIYQPWAVSGDNYYDYYPGGDYTNDLTGAYENADWGVYNAIFNGGNLPQKWRTLSKDEWQYILKDRPNAEQLCSFVKVKNIRGLIILPDNFFLPDGVSFIPGETEPNANYTESEWLLLEQNGAVFLPMDVQYTFSLGAAGWGNSHVYYTSTHGGANEERHAYSIYLNTLNIYTIRYRCDGGQVRVACTVPPVYTITVQSSDNAAGTTSGAGSFYQGAIKQISATHNTCYQFIQWSDGNTDNPRTITVTEDATYTAEFEKIKYTISTESDDPAQGSTSVTK